MGRKGGRRHLKRLPAPATWSIHRKEFRWVVKARAGSHGIDQCLPLLLVVRDILKMAKTRREAKVLLSGGHVRVDGRVRREDDYPVGLMDVVDMPSIEKTYRVLPTQKGELTLHAVAGEEKEFKLCQIVNKTSVKGGCLRLGLHDGRNVLLKLADPRNPVEDVYETHDTLKIQVPDMKVFDHLKLEEGVLAMVTGGKNIGRMGEVVEIEREKGPHSPAITLKDAEGNRFETIIDYVFAIGKGVPWISALEEDKQ